MALRLQDDCVEVGREQDNALLGEHIDYDRNRRRRGERRCVIV